MRRRRFGWALAAVLALTLAVGALPRGQMVAEAAATPPNTKVVNIFGRRFSPGTVKVAPGTKILFRNGDRVKHEIVGNTFRDSFNRIFDISPDGESPLPRGTPMKSSNGPLEPRPAAPFPGGQRPKENDASFWTFAPSEEGSYSYRCAIHPKMGGLIVVGNVRRAGDPLPTPRPPPAGPTPTPQPRLPIVTIFGNRFQPPKVQIVEGEKIRFRNGDRADHRVVSSTFRSAEGIFYDWSPDPDESSGLEQAPVAAVNLTLEGRPLADPGELRPPAELSDAITFDQSGTYTYRGELTTMRGTIVVVTPTPER